MNNQNKTTHNQKKHKYSQISNHTNKLKSKKIKNE